MFYDVIYDNAEKYFGVSLQRREEMIPNYLSALNNHPVY